MATRSPWQFSLLTLLVACAVVGFACWALLNATETSAACLNTALMLSMLGASIVAIACPGGPRMFCAGFLAATWTYLLLGQLQGRQGMELILDPLWQQVRKDVSSGEYTHDQVALNVGVIIPPYPAEWQPAHEAFLAVGVRLTALGLGVIGGWLAVVLWRPSQPRSGDTFQPPA